MNTIENKRWNQYYDLLLDFCDINMRAPYHKETYKNVRIGKWFHYIKSQIKSNNHEYYIKLAGNQYLQQSLDKYLVHLNNVNT